MANKVKINRYFEFFIFITVISTLKILSEQSLNIKLVYEHEFYMLFIFNENI